jgi:O-antigen/teichoic acid export membrane protein
MIAFLRSRTIALLQWSEKYTKTDMLYLAQGGFWLLVGQAGAIIFSLTLAVIFGHFATQDTYGNYKYIINIGSLLTVLSLSGIGTAVTRAAARGDEGSLRQGFSLSMRWSVGMVLAGLIASAYYFYIGNVFAGVGLAITAIALPLMNGLTLYDSFLIGLRKFRTDVLYSIASLAFTTISLGITLLFFSQRAIILVAVYFVTNLLSDGLWYLLTTRRTRNNKTDPEMLNYGFHLSLMGVLGAVADKIDSIIIFAFLGPAQLAVYSFAIAMPEQIKAVVKNVTPLSMPKFAQRTIPDIRQTIWSKVMLLGLSIAAATFAYILLAPIIFQYLFPIYVSSIGYSQIYALSILFSFVAPLSSVFQAHKKTKELYIFSNVPAIVLIVTLPILTYLYGIAGAIASQILYRATTALIVIVLFRHLKED